MRVVATIVLLTFAATVGCSTYRWVPAEPQPDADTCEELVGRRAQVYVTMSLVWLDGLVSESVP